MTRLGMVLAAAHCSPRRLQLAQTVGSCVRGGGANQPQAVWILFDLGSAQVGGDNKSKIARSKAVAAELVSAGIPAKDIVIAADPEAFGNMSLGNLDAQAKDRKVMIPFSR